VFKALKMIVIGLVGMVVGIIWIAQPGHQGMGGGIALTLVGLFIILRGLKLFMGGGGAVSVAPSRTRDSGQPVANLFSRRRVITPQDSRPTPPFDL